MFSGSYKNLPELSWFPVDFTLLFFAATLWLIFAAAICGRIKSFSPGSETLLLILFSALALASLFWSSLEEANFDKAWRFLFLTATSFLVAHMIAEEPERRQRLVRMLFWFSAALLLYYAYCRYLLGMSMQAGGDVGADNYLEYGLVACIFFLLCATSASFGPPRQFYVALAGAGTAFYLLLIMGGRGPFTDAVIAFVLLLGFGFRWRRARLLPRLVCYLGLLGAAAAGYIMFAEPDAAELDSEFQTVWRIRVQLSGEDTVSMDERIFGRALATRMWLEEPVFGAGLGDFVVRDPYLRYPHNLLFEILAELGIVGAVLFFSTVALAVLHSVRIARDRTCEWTDAAIVLLFMSQLFTHLWVQGYLADDRVLFALMGLVVGSVRGRSARPTPSLRVLLPRRGKEAQMHGKRGELDPKTETTG